MASDPTLRYTMSLDKYKECLPEGTRCEWIPGVEGLPRCIYVTVMGVGMNPLPVLGHMYIVEPDDPLPGYPYPMILAAEVNLYPIPVEELRVSR